MESTGMETAAGGLTYEDLLLLPDDGKRHELIGGEHYVTPAPSFLHQNFVGRLCRVIANFLEENQLGALLAAPFDVMLSRNDVVEPDLLFIGNDRMKSLNNKRFEGAPDLVVEVISESTRLTDKKVKRLLYEQNEVVEYWIADPQIQTIEVYRRDQENRLVRMAEYEDAGTLTSPLLPGLSIDVASLWKLPDRAWSVGKRE